MDTKQFVDASKMQTDGDDLRLAYKNAASDWSEVRRTFSYLGSETFATSQRTQVSFTTAASIAASSSDANYALYYGNATVNYNWSNGLKFDGVDDDVLIPDSDSIDLGTTNFTLEQWVKIRTNKINTVIDKRVNGGVYTGYLVYFDETGKFNFDLNDTAAHTYRGAYGSNVQGKWVHWALTVNRTTNQASYYLNGTKVVTVDISATTGSLANGENLQVVGHTSVPSYRADGIVDEVRISNTVRYDPGNNFAVGQKVFNPPVENLTSDANTMGLWHLDEGTGQTVGDSSSYANNGTLGPTAGAEAQDPTWYSPNQQSFGDETFVAPFNNSTTGIDGETPSSFTRNSVATYEDENGKIQEAAANNPRYETGQRGRNLLKNSSFETGSPNPDNWTFMPGDTWSLSSSQYVHGTKSMSQTTTTAWTGWRSDAVTVTEGKLYAISGSLYATGLTGTDNSRAWY